MFETGEMPADFNADEFPSERVQSYEEAKRALEEKDAQKQVEEQHEVEEEKKEADDSVE